MEFKPCPFCGNTTINIIPLYQYNKNEQAICLYSWVECSECQARTAKLFIDKLTESGFSHSKAYRKNPKILYGLWNRRVNEE